ncbi:hypothetical protein DTO027I6_9812 [Penicillium roqueforti]|nr:hypothetical protein CBS147337_9895 [Penicillium roqueforti]KAI3185296.1 hypothetical protein DTO027I6_9812 [Penicillium roqueforti]
MAEQSGSSVAQQSSAPGWNLSDEGKRHDVESNGQYNRAAHQATVSQVAQPQFMKLANPGPLGLLSFAITTFVVGLYECGAGLPGSNPEGNVGPNQAAFGICVFMGGTAQFLAGLMEYRVGNTFGTTVHCSYGAFWLSYAMYMLPYLGIEAAYKGDQRAYTFALGIYLILWGFLTLLFLVAALRTNIAILLVFFFLVLAYLFLGIANFIATQNVTASEHLNKAGGAFAVVCAFCAFYAGASGLMVPETTWVRFPLESAYVKKSVSSNVLKPASIHCCWWWFLELGSATTPRTPTVGGDALDFGGDRDICRGRSVSDERRERGNDGKVAITPHRFSSVDTIQNRCRRFAQTRPVFSRLLCWCFNQAFRRSTGRFLGSRSVPLQLTFPANSSSRCGCETYTSVEGSVWAVQSLGCFFCVLIRDLIANDPLVRRNPSEFYSDASARKPLDQAEASC